MNKIPLSIPEMVDKFIQNRSYLTNGAGFLAKHWQATKDEVKRAKKIAYNKIEFGTEYHPDDVAFKDYNVISHIQYENHCKKLYSNKKDSITKPNNILIIADTHIPYEKEGYLEFCKEQYDKYGCTEVIHIGDLIDLHATSRHPTVPEAYSPGDEFKYSLEKLKAWYRVFPKVKVVRGNHDERVAKMASYVGVPSYWIKDFTEALGVPDWEFEESFIIGDITFIHGTGTSGVTAAYRRALNLGMNVVIGHLHAEAGILYHKLPNKTIWGMTVGSGVDEDSYGMLYAKNYPKKSIISCGIIYEGQPIIKIME